MDVSHITVAGLKLRVGISAGSSGSIPLLVFNGLGADLEVFAGFARELEALGIGIVIFDVPGIGGSDVPALPYRFAWLARLANGVLGKLGIAGPVDVAGMSWGGALAQEFTHRYPKRVRRLVLAATSAGALAVPGRLSALSKMLDVRLYIDPGYMARVGGELYGGKMRDTTAPLERYGKVLRPVGCSLQLVAVTGWTSAFWLHTVRQPTLIMMGTDDPLVPVVNGRLLASLMPHAKLVTVADGHLFLLTSARECAPVIAAFLTAGPHARSSTNGSIKSARIAP
jgi:poly(3-hydroxyalkanoate) depolymerase